MQLSALAKTIKKRKWWLAALLPFSIFFLLPLPRPLFQVSYATVLQSRDGTLLGAKIAQDEQWRFPVDDSVPDKFLACVRLYEDEYFFRHPGINPVSLAKALVQNVQSGKVVRGGSTLSMQVVRMAQGNEPRTYGQKIKEMLLALKLELYYSKKEIFNLYVAHAPFGSNVVGLSAAAWRYYRKNPENLSWSECATLSVLPNSPSLIYPGKNEEALQRKRDFVLQKLLQRAHIDTLTYQLALLEPLPGLPHRLPELAPRLLSRCLKDGYGGQRVRSTIDVRLQNLVKNRVVRHHQMMRANHVYNAAALVIDVQSGQALAYVGNTDGPGDHGQYVDIITANRSTGSLLKPVLYGAAMDEGLVLPYQLLPDIPVSYQGFAPQNFDKKFYGAVPADVSLIRSLNVPFVYMLRAYGYERFHQQLKDMGLASLSQPAGHYGLSLILGGAESSLWDITALYAGMVRTLIKAQRTPHQSGVPFPLYFPNSYLPDEHRQAAGAEPGEVISPSSVWHTFQAMQQVRRPEEQAGWERFPSASRIAWKTGTSFGFRDAWAVGLNDRYVVGVWIGNADGEGRPELIGVKAAAPLLFDIFESLDGSMDFPQPVRGSSEVIACRKSGFPAGEFCEDTEVVYTSTKNRQGSCPYHKQLHLSEDSTFQVNSSCYPIAQMVSASWFVLPPAQAWYYKQYHMDYSPPPPLGRGCQQPEQMYMEMIYPSQQTRLYIPRELDGRPGKAVFSIAHLDNNATLYWHLDDGYLGKTKGRHEYGISSSWGKHVLHVVDDKGRSLTYEFEII